MVIPQTTLCLSLSFNQTVILTVAVNVVFHRGVEPQVLDFQTQQQKLFPWLASAYAYWFAGESMLRQHQTITAQIEKGDVEALPEVNDSPHAAPSFHILC